MDPADDQYLSVEFDFSRRVRGQQSLPGWDPARLQRAPEGAGESPGGGRHDVIQRRGARGVDARVDPIVLGNRRVDPKEDRPLLGRQVGPAQGPLYALDAYRGSIGHWIAHGALLTVRG